MRDNRAPNLYHPTLESQVPPTGRTLRRVWHEVTKFGDRERTWIPYGPPPTLPHRATVIDWADLLDHLPDLNPPTLAATTAELDHLWLNCNGTERPPPCGVPIEVLGHPITEIDDWPDWMST